MIDLAAQYKGNLEWLPAATVLLAQVGSRAYGTATPESDDDWKGVAVPPRRYHLGHASRFEQAQLAEPDATIYDLRKFVRLAAECNPSIIEALFVDEAGVALQTDVGRRLRAARGLFLSRRARHTFSGYAMAQLKRIDTHHRWLVDPPQAPPERAAHGLPGRTLIPADQLAAAQAAVEKRLDEWRGVRFLDGLDPATRVEVQGRIAEYLAELRVASVDDLWRGAAAQVGLDENFISLLERERSYQAALRHWRSYQTWCATRNPARAELEARHGYDTKHGTHLVRLLRMGREILERGEVLVRRPDAEELRAIRAGAWTYERIVAWAEAEDAALADVEARSPLPKVPDARAIEDLCVDLVERALSIAPEVRP